MAHRNPGVHLGSPRFTTAEFGGFLVTDISFPGGLLLPSHTHDRTVLAVTLGGRWESTLGSHTAESTSGHVLTEPAGDRHSNRFHQAGARVLVVQPDVRRATELFPRHTLLCEVHHFQCLHTAALAKRLQLEVHQRDTVSALAIEGLCLELIATASRSHDSRFHRERGAKWLTRALDYAHAHYLSAPSVGDLASAAGVHPAHLARGFRREVGFSVASYVRQLRIHWAADRLASSSAPIADIAVAAGFVDQSHFSRLFRRFVGQTPSEYRRREAARRTRQP